MSRYQWSATVPPQTDKVDSVTETITVEERVLTAGNRFAPPGADGEVLARLNFGARSILPSPESTPSVLPERADMVDLNFRLPGVPTELELEVWAPNADFQHTVTATVDTKEAENVAQEVVLRDVSPVAATGERVDRGLPEDL